MSKTPRPTLPDSYSQTVMRGIRCTCPRCGEGHLFRKWLKPVDFCVNCAVDFTHQRADDLPAYLAILITGHLLAPLMIMLTMDFDLSPLAILAILIPLSVAMMLAMLQPAKGAVIATQWWFGMHGFVRERPAREA